MADGPSDDEPDNEPDNGPRDSDAVATVLAALRSKVAVSVLIVVAAVLLALTATNVWVKGQMLDTDTWVATSDRLLTDDEIRARLSVFVVDELYATVDVGAQLEQRLPEQLAGLAGPVAVGLRGPAIEVVDRLLATRAAQEIWSRSNRRAHQTFLAVVRDDAGPAISTADGTIALELDEVVAALARRLGLPEATIERIPDDAGRLVVLESDRLEDVQELIRWIEWASIVLAFVIVGLFAAAIALARGWRRVAIRWIGFAVTIDALLLLFVQRIARAHVLDHYVAVSANRPAVANAWWIATELLRELAWTGLAVGAITVIATILVGPAGPARTLRRRIGPTMRANPGATWGGVAIVLLVVAAWTPLNTLSVWIALLAISSVAIASVGAFVWACGKESGDDVPIS